MHLQERRARVQPVEAHMGRVEAEFFVVGLAEEARPPDVRARRPDHLDGACVGTTVFGASFADRRSAGSSIIVSMKSVLLGGVRLPRVSSGSAGRSIARCRSL